MVEYANAECATCHAIRPKNEMRQVRVKRLSGVSHGSGRTSRSSTSWVGSDRSRSSNSSSNSTRRSYKMHDLWVCPGCRAPKSDKEGIGLWVWAAGAAIVLFAVASQNGKDSDLIELIPAAQDIDLRPEVETEIPTRTETKPSQSVRNDLGKEPESDIVFERSPVVQQFDGQQSGPTDAVDSTMPSTPPQYDCSAVTEEGRVNLDYLKTIGCESVYVG